MNFFVQGWTYAAEAKDGRERLCQGWTYAVDDSKDGGGRAKQEARVEDKDGRERLCQK
ncbi:hypothetical protein [Sedimenticola sp.]|uniref:hypothetical protein n=1 Tax=Sedimenticola sp. TaxID=1940285 RepID=UPI003D10D0B7